jgi:WD40 repeat protein
VAWSPDGKHVAARSLGEVKIFDVALGVKESTLTLPADMAFVDAVSFSPDGKRLAVGATAKSMKDGVIFIYDAAGGPPKETISIPQGTTHWVFFIDDKTLISQAYVGATVFDIPSGRPLWPLNNWRSGSSTWNYAVISPNRRYLATGEETTGQMCYWDIATGGIVARLTGQSSGVRHVAFSSDGKKVLSAASDGAVRVWALPGE